MIRMRVEWLEGRRGRRQSMLGDAFGPPQLAALLILLQRGLEELHSQRNTRRLLEQGAREAGGDYYPVVAATHLAWIASLAFLVPPSAPVHILPLLAFLALQPLRYWIIGTLGRYWTHRIITLPDAPIVAKGPYRFLRHPNYAVTLAETLLLPIAFGQPALGLIFVVIWGAVLHYKIRLEDQALALRRGTVGGPP
jgi:methyltransferase